VLVVGAGPAGLAAALAEGRAGARVIVADEPGEFGGSLLSLRESIDGRAAPEWVASATAEPAAVKAAQGPLPVAPAFTLTDTQGKDRSLAEFAGKYVVLEWINPECPFVKKFYNVGKMQQWQEKYTDKGIVWLIVTSAAPGKQGFRSPDEWNSYIEEQGIKATALLQDNDGQVGRAYGATNTPHMYVINPDGKLIYQGAIDDNPSADSADIDTAHNYVTPILDAALNSKTRAYGCSVKY